MKVGLIGPGAQRPCGIADYTRLLAEALRVETDLMIGDFKDALENRDFADCDAILVHYERSLVPDRMYLRRLGKVYRNRLFVVPHEVYDEDPYAFPPSQIRSTFAFGLALKRMLYGWRHRDYLWEKRLQRRGYYANKIIPLSEPNANAFRALGVLNLAATVPLACPEPHSLQDIFAAPDLDGLFPSRPSTILGIFGFLGSGSDYISVMQALHAMDGKPGLLIMGGDRLGSSRADVLKSDIHRLGLGDRVHITGYIPEADLPNYFRLCDAFIAPFKFKSNSASLVRLFPCGQPIYAPDIPIVRYLKEAGGPIEIYANTSELVVKLRTGQRNGFPLIVNRYPWSFPAVAQEYLRLMAWELEKRSLNS